MYTSETVFRSHRTSCHQSSDCSPGLICHWLIFTQFFMMHRTVSAGIHWLLNTA